MSGYLDDSWPSVDVLEGLVEKFSGQFIYASTVVKYISSIRHQPADRLDVVLGIRPPRNAHEMPFSELDAFYADIFASVDSEDRKTVLLILGHYMVIVPVAIYSLMDIGDLELFFLLRRGDIEMLFGDLSSLVAISNVKPYIHLFHASLGEFLRDPARSKEFYIDLSDIHTRYMYLCFHHIKQCALSFFFERSCYISTFNRLNFQESWKSHRVHSPQLNMALPTHSTICIFATLSRDNELFPSFP